MPEEQPRAWATPSCLRRHARMRLHARQGRTAASEALPNRIQKLPVERAVLAFQVQHGNGSGGWSGCTRAGVSFTRIMLPAANGWAAPFRRVTEDFRHTYLCADGVEKDGIALMLSHCGSGGPGFRSRARRFCFSCKRSSMHPNLRRKQEIGKWRTSRHKIFRTRF